MRETSMRSYLPRVATAAVAVALAASATLLVADKSFWLMLGVACMCCAFVCPQLLCYGLVPAITLDGVLTLQAGPLRAGPTDLIVGALAVALVLHRLRPAPRTVGADRVLDGGRMMSALRSLPKRQPGVFPIGGMLAAYVAAIVLSSAVASSRADTLKEVLKWTEVLIVFGGGVAFLARPGRKRVLVGVMLACGVLEAWLGYGQWALAAGATGQSSLGLRVFGTFGQPNPYAAYLNLSLPLALALALFGHRWADRWLAIGATAILAGAQLLANSRGALLALAAAIIVMVVVATGYERITALVGGAAVALLGVAAAVHILPLSLQTRMLHTLRLDNVSLSGPLNDANFSSVERLAHWVAGLRMFAAHPILGVGAGNYSDAYPRYEVTGWHLALGHAHDYYINVAAETGVVGLLAFLGVSVAALFVAWQAARWQAASGAVATTKSAAESDRQGTPASDAHAGQLRHRTATATHQTRADASGLLTRVASVLVDTAEQRACALGLLGVLVGIAVHNLVDDLFVHGMELQMGLCLALVVLLAGGAAPHDGEDMPRLA